jgi:hypothetical protein
VYVCMYVCVSRCCGSPLYFQVSFATAPGLQAREPSDPAQRNGVFTAALLDQLRARGSSEDASKLMRRVTQAVREATGDKQKPWTHSTLPVEDVFVLPPAQGGSSGGWWDELGTGRAVVLCGS